MVRTEPFDAARYLVSPESQAELLNDALASGDASYVAQTLGVIARARGMTEVAREAGVTREALYKALSENGDPRLTTLLGVARALGVRLTAEYGPGGRTRKKSFTRENLQFLVEDIYKSQTALAQEIAPNGPTQPMISQLLGNSRRRRQLPGHERQAIEQKLGIPNGWLAKYPLRSVWPILRQYKLLPTDAQQMVNSIVGFVERNVSNHNLVTLGTAVAHA